MSYENLPLLDESDLALLKTSNTDLSMLDDQVPLSSLFQLVEVPKNTTLTATGMYFVLSGHISLQLNGSEIATATVSDYFYEEYLLLEDHNIEVTAKSKTDSRLGFLAKDEWDALPEKTQTKSLSKLFGNLVNTHLHEFQQPINCCNITAAAFG